MIPEPFSITLSVFATLGFLNLARQGAHALYKDVEAYKKTPAEIMKALKNIASIKHRIELWKQVWLIHSDTHEDYPTFLWGNGWEHIQIQIEIIEEISNQISELIAPYVREWEAQRSSKDSPTIDHHDTLGMKVAQRTVMQKEDLRTLSSQIWCGKKIVYVLSKSKKLKDFFVELPTRFDALNRICEEEYFEKHDMNRSMPNSARRDTATFEMLVSQAWKSRQTSRALYEQCCLAVEGDIELELSLLKWKAEKGVPRPFNAGISKCLCFYLTIPSTTLTSMVRLPADVEEAPAAPSENVPTPLEVLIEETAKVPTEHKASFRDACLDLLHKNTCYLRDTVIDGDTTSKPAAFKLWISSDKVGNSGRVESTLQDLLSHAAFSTNVGEQDLSFRERIEVAYRIAECTLLLLETSWLSSLESSNITRAHAADLASRYRLLVRHRDAGRNDHEAQTLLVGQLLRELALGTNIGPFDRDKDLALVSTEIGQQYQRALDFCYKSHPSVRNRHLIARNQQRLSSKVALVQFFNEVFVPLAELHESSAALMNQDSFSDNNPNKSNLKFLPATYTEQSRPMLGGQIPSLSTSRKHPATLLSTFRSSMKALSIRSGSTLGQFRKSDAIVYYVATQKFARVAKDNIPEDAHRLEIPSSGMTYDIYLPSDESPQGSLIATLSFEELGLRVIMRRLLGKINELYVVDQLTDALGG